jgi:tetratricopeptide (TPR) repeat protein
MPPSPKAIQIFYSYIPEDEKWQKELEKQLSSGLHRDGLISHWHHQLIPPGNIQQQDIDDHLNTAHIFLLLVSPGFLASDYCRNVEVEKALERHKNNEAHVIPVILEHSDWKTSTFGMLQSLPRDGRPACQWQTSEAPFFHIAREIRQIIDKLIAREWLNYGQILCKNKFYEKALRAFENALKYAADHTDVYNSMGDVYHAQHHNEEALKAYETAIRYDPRSTWAWYGIGNTYKRQRNFEEALDAYQQVTTIDPDDAQSAWAWYEQGKIQQRLNHLSEALDAYERATITGQKAKDLALFHRDRGAVYEKLEKFADALAEAEKALSFDPEDISSYRNKGFALGKLERFDEALQTFEEAIRRKPDYPNAHLGKGKVLRQLGKYQEALQEIEEAIRLKGNYIWAWRNKETTLKLLAKQAREDAEKYDKLAQEAHNKVKQLSSN